MSRASSSFSRVLLSYLSNTLSFLRIGAFAVSHAAMMEVVMMLAGAANGGNPNWIVIVLGNLFVCAMEGLIVGHPGTASGILRDIQPLLCRQRQGVPSLHEKNARIKSHESINMGF